MDQTSTNEALEPGEIHFVDNYLPILAAGRYTIKVEQSLEGSGAQPAKASFLETQEFEVRGPRFRLDPADIQQKYPPPNSQGIFQHDLPHIVLTKRTLPWERSLSKEDQTIPWMALLIFDASEIRPAGEMNKEDQAANPAGVTTLEVTKLLTPEKGILTGFDPLVPLDGPDQELSCQVIALSPDTFKAVMPKWDELKYLTHCRVVKLAQKAVPGPDRPQAQLTPGNGTAWFSVVVGGRFPSPPPEGKQTGELNVVHLVSLEGLDRYIKEPETIPPDTRCIRLISLANWVFTCLPAMGEDFGELMRNLVKGGPLNYQLPFQKTGSKAGKFASRMLEAGYVPHSYHTRLGEETFAWYRGPFTPQLAPRLPPGRQPFSSAAQAMIYDPDHGLFDLSYAVAWEIGRLLALSDQRFGKLLLNRRRKAHHLVDLLQERNGQNSPPGSPAMEGGSQRLKELLEGSPASEAVLHHLVGDFAREIEPLIFEPNNQRPSDANPGSPAQDNTYLKLADYHKEQDVQQLLMEIDSDELKSISEWLAHLYLLYGVPFNHLVPDERLLPPETIRFFYLDQNWLEVSLDGALSIGMHSSRDLLYQNLIYEVITEAVHKRIQTLRDDLLGNDQKTTGNASKGPLAGLLIRSAVVSGWPGLEVRAYRQSDGSQGSEPVGILRMDRPAADVLLCIFNQVPAWVEFNEPKEGLHFGLENGEIGLRYVSGDQDKVGKLCRPEENLHTKCDDRHRLNIQKMLITLEEKKKVLGLNETEVFGPAAFALQMVKVPQQMVFQTKTSPDHTGF